MEVKLTDLQKIVIVSELFATHPSLPGDEVVQEVLLYPDGQCFFETWIKTAKASVVTPHRQQALQVPPQVIAELLEMLLTTDVQSQPESSSGSWLVRITTLEQKTVVFRGRIRKKLKQTASFAQQISAFIRQHLACQEMILLDNYQLPQVIGLTFAYEQIGSEWDKDGDEPTRINEKFELQRETATLTYEQCYDETEIYQRYRDQNVLRVLDTLNYHHFQPQTVQNTGQVLVNPNVSRKFVCELVFADREPIRLAGNFDCEELPPGYERLARHLQTLLQQHARGIVFDREAYQQRKRRQGDYLFIKVEFEQSSGSYHYVSDDPTVQINDTVIVPVGQNNRELQATVVERGYYSAEDAPFPLHRTKKIIKKVKAELFSE